MIKISFPHMGNYYIAMNYLLKKITKQEVLIAPKITRKTIELGSKYSPDFVCVPFKYNLGNYIEALDQGANVLFQAGGGCRYGYYAELQEKILRDLGYEFEFISLMQNGKMSLNKLYKYAKKYNKKLNIFSYYYYILNAFIIILIIDKYEKYMRENMGFEIEKDSFKKLHNELLNELGGKINLFKLLKINRKYKKSFHNLKIDKKDDHLKVALVGELYSIMEPFSSNYIEKKLIEKKIEVYRQTTLSYLLLKKRFVSFKRLKEGKKYIKYHLGADGTESVVLSYKKAKENYDGIVHIKSFGCTPEINAMSIMNKVSEEEQIPIIYFSFDSQDSEVAVTTRIEAFYDMILSKKENN